MNSGPSTILALVIFYFYRKDTKKWLHRDEELTGRFEAVSVDFKSVVQENTKAITVLCERINK